MSDHMDQKSCHREGETKNCLPQTLWTGCVGSRGMIIVIPRGLPRAHYRPGCAGRSVFFVVAI